MVFPSSSIIIEKGWWLLKSKIRLYCNQAIILTWVQKPRNAAADHFWGLGDYLRGALLLYRISRKYEYRYIVDTQHHPISEFLVQEIHPYSALVYDRKYKIDFKVFTDNHSAVRFIVQE